MCFAPAPRRNLLSLAQATAVSAFAPLVTHKATMSDYGAALLAATIEAGIRAKAPRRTVQAVASAVAGVLTRPADAERLTVTRPPRAGTAVPHDASGDPAQLIDTLRAGRRMQRLKKKRRRNAAKLAARDSTSRPDEPDTAGPRADSGVESAAVPAPASGAPAAGPTSNAAWKPLTDRSHRRIS